jgi:amino acid transporter
MGQAFFLFMGFELVTAQVEVARGPAVITRVLATSVVLLTAFYGLLAAGFSCLPEEIAAGSQAFIPQMALAQLHGGTIVVLLLAGLSMLAFFASFHGALLSLSRLASALAAQRLLPRALARIEPRSLMPRTALACLLAAAVLAALALSEGSLMRPAILAASVAAACVYAALAWVRERPPFADAGRPWLARGMSAVLAAVLLAVALGVLVDAGLALPATLALVGASVLVALVVARRSRQPGRTQPRAPVTEEIEHARG